MRSVSVRTGTPQPSRATATPAITADPFGADDGDLATVDLDTLDAVDCPQCVGCDRRVAVDLGDDQVGADRPLEVDRGALGLDPAAGDDGHPVGQFVGLLEVLGGEEDRHAERLD